MLTICILFLAIISVNAREQVVRSESASGRIIGAAPLEYTLDLDKPQKDRWTPIVAANKDKLKAATDYFNQYIPAALQPLVIKIGAHLQQYFPDYHDELTGIADASGIPVGEITALNLVYQIEKAFNHGCSMQNTTGPCDNSTIIQPCTSTVAMNSQGVVTHGRNLDFSFPRGLDELIVNVDFQRGGKTVFKGTTILGYVGVMNAMKPNGFTYSLNARDRGGDVAKNLLTLMLGARTPTQLARLIFESDCADFTCAKKHFSENLIANPVYFILGGLIAEGAIITRNRQNTANTWDITDTSNDGANWFKLQTNYDNWEPVPDYDNRRDPGNANMQTMGQTGLTAENLYNSVLLQDPVFNAHTDFTTVMSASTGYYNTTVWLRDD